MGRVDELNEEFMKYFYKLQNFVEDLSKVYPKSFYTGVAIGIIALGILLLTAIIS